MRIAIEPKTKLNTNTFKFVLFVVSGMISLSSFAQNTSVKGIVSDTANKRKLAYAVIALFNAKDSLLVTSCRSLSDGNFLLKDLKAGSYNLLITYPQMADFILDINLKEKDTINIGNIIMTSKVRLLEEVIVKSTVAAIRMKGDTLEYKADSFVVRPGANIEELLKRLPGIQVNRDGTIKAQGEKVGQILVDGDEFFADDPTLATKYLQAASVDKIQVFDKKSEQSTFTGIDDGKHTKTINIKLKENSKQGYFGKLSSGSNGSSFYNHEAMFNRFRSKQKIAVFGTTSNIGMQGLSGGDTYQYMGGDDEYIDDRTGKLLFSYNDYDGDVMYGSGLPTNTSTGINFSDKWHDYKRKVNGNYRFNKQTTNGWQKNNFTQILPDSSTQATTGNSANTSLHNGHKLTGTYNITIDTLSSIKIFVKGSKSEDESQSSSNSETINAKTGNFINKSTQNTWNNGSSNQFNSSILWRQKFRKNGRTFSMNLQQSLDKTNNQLQTEAVNFLYDPVTTIPTSESPNQLQRNNGSTNAYAAKIAYTEPLSKQINMEFSYAIKRTNREKNRSVFEKDANNKYEKFIDSLSRGYRYKVTSHLPSLLLNLSKKKYNLSLGGQLGFTNMQQTGISSTLSSRNFINFFPQANFKWNLKQNKAFNLGYNGSTEQPSIDQLQPLRDKSNSLSESIGNPNLKPAFKHHISLNYNSFNFDKGTNIVAFADYSITQNSIISSQEYDQFNKSTNQYINLDGISNSYAYIAFNKDLRKLNLDIGMSLLASHSGYLNVINKATNNNQNNSFGITPSIRYDQDNKFSISIQSSINYSNSSSSIGNATNVNQWSHNHTVDVSVFLPWKLELKTDANMNFQPANSAFNKSNNIIRWNAALVKKVTKNEKLEIKLSVFDILNQATNYNRYASGNYSSETTNNYIPRYGLLSLAWNFTHTHK